MRLMPPPPIMFNIVLDRDVVVMPKIVNLLNKIAESRFDGTNAAYVNTLQPELDFTQDQTILHDFYEDGIEKIVSQLEPYINNIGLYVDEDTHEEVEGKYEFVMIMPYNWKHIMKEQLRKKFETYIVYKCVADWVEKVSIKDTEYSLAKADELLFELKRICEMRQGKVHVSWNSTYL